MAVHTIKRIATFLSKNKKKASTEAQQIFMAQGIAGVMEFTRNMALKNV